MPWLRASRLLGRLSLFWRTFLYLALLLAGSVLAWQQTFRALELEPRSVQNARQVASLVNLTRAAMVHADPIARVSLIKTLADQEGLHLAPREPGDRHLPADDDPLSRPISNELHQRLGPGTVVARQVNGLDGLWVAFSMGEDTYWLRLDNQRISPLAGHTLLVWLLAATVLSLAGAAVIAGLINRPLQRLSFATSKVREGDFNASHLDEKVPTAEIREVNIGFNRMARQLAQIEYDRSLMLAGISHDLRTPLARLRLETEMSVPDAQARSDMAADIEQVNTIIDQFLDYARPAGPGDWKTAGLAEVVHKATQAFRQREDLQLAVAPLPELSLQADPVDLLRVLTNLLENARRYGQTPGRGFAEVRITARSVGPLACLAVTDRGAGVEPAVLNRLTQPFFRGDQARSQASGAGLGLAVVDKLLQRMGGRLELRSPVANGAGFQAEIWVRLVAPGQRPPG